MIDPRSIDAYVHERLDNGGVGAAVGPGAGGERCGRGCRAATKGPSTELDLLLRYAADDFGQGNGGLIDLEGLVAERWAAEG
jgi:hypothetical protein